MTTYDDLTAAVLAGIDRDALRAAASHLTRHGHNPFASYNADRPDAPISAVSAIERAAMDIDTRDWVARHTLQTFAAHILRSGARYLSEEDSRRAIQAWETSIDLSALVTTIRRCATKSASRAKWIPA